MMLNPEPVQIQISPFRSEEILNMIFPTRPVSFVYFFIISLVSGFIV